MDKDLNTFLSFSDEVTPFKFKNNLRMILGSKPGKFENIKTQKNVWCSYKKSVYLSYLTSINVPRKLCELPLSIARKLPQY